MKSQMEFWVTTRVGFVGQNGSPGEGNFVARVFMLQTSRTGVSPQALRSA